MKVYESKCCGAMVEYKFYEWSSSYSRAETLEMTMGGKTLEKSGLKPFCSRCHKPCEIKETKKSQGTALYASLRR